MYFALTLLFVLCLWATLISNINHTSIIYSCQKNKNKNKIENRKQKIVLLRTGHRTKLLILAITLLTGDENQRWMPQILGFEFVDFLHTGLPSWASIKWRESSVPSATFHVSHFPFEHEVQATHSSYCMFLRHGWSCFSFSIVFSKNSRTRGANCLMEGLPAVGSILLNDACIIRKLKKHIFPFYASLYRRSIHNTVQLLWLLKTFLKRNTICQNAMMYQECVLFSLLINTLAIGKNLK